MRLILASASPRRVELLSRITTDFIAVPSDIDEVASSAPERQVVQLARDKAGAVARRHHGVIIGADTIVVIDNEILGKPRSRTNAREMLTQLSGRTHRVLTGVYIVSTYTGEERANWVETAVTFRKLAADEIEWYLETEEYMDKAGAYAIQEQGALFVEGICGDYFNVMGLPLTQLYLMLRDLGYRLSQSPRSDKKFITGG